MVIEVVIRLVMFLSHPFARRLLPRRRYNHPPARLISGAASLIRH